MAAVSTAGPEDGLVKRARARSTGTLIEVWRADALGLDDEAGNWVTICEHGSSCHHATRAQAVGWSAEPEQWCETGCRADWNNRHPTETPMDVWDDQEEANR